MAPAQKAESRAPVMALSLFAVLALAKICVATAAGFPITPFTFADDALTAVIFALVEWLTRRRRWIATVLYIVLVGYAAINVPLARLTSSAMTLQMFRASGAALSDSIAHHLTAANIGLILLIAVAAFIFPLAMRCVRPSIRFAGLVLLFAFAVISLLLPRSNARNAFTTLVQSARPRVEARSSNEDWCAPIATYSRTTTNLEFLQGTAAGRNIVIIALESTGAQYLKPYGATSDPMPNVTKLATEGILFENAYAVYPESIKGLFSVLCSRYPAFDTDAADYARVTTPAIAEVACRAGYRTALFHSGRFMYLGMRDIIDNRGFELLEDAGHIGGNHESSFGVDEPAAVRRMLQWTDSLSDKEKFCLMYLPIAGHHPYEVPGATGYAGATEQQRYLTALRYSDAAIGQLLDGLKQRAVYTNTLFVLYGDHGEAFGQHEGNFGHTFFLYEENVRVPLLIAAPGLITSPRRVERVASLIDVAPTIVDLVGFAAPCDWQGASLLDGGARAALFFTDYSLPLVGVRDGPWKFIHELGTSHTQLFDMRSDTAEAIDVSRAHSTIVATYRERLAHWAAAQKALLKP